MRRPSIVSLVLAGLGAVLVATATARMAAEDPKPLAHMVFFTLKDHSAESRSKFVDSTRKHLGAIEGTTYFSVGSIAEDADVQEGASVKEWDVALHVVFPDKAAKAAYLKNPHHDAFVAENKDQFEKVQVFDSFLSVD